MKRAFVRGVPAKKIGSVINYKAAKQLKPVKNPIIPVCWCVGEVIA
jgi:hypothetical protein